MFPTLKMFGVGAIPWSPLARGMLTRPVSQKESTSRGKSDIWASEYKGPGSGDIIGRVEDLAKKKGVSMAQIATAWSLSKEGVCAPIVGTTKLQNLKEAIDALNIARRSARCSQR